MRETFRETKKTLRWTEHASSFCFMPSFGTHAFMANKRREWGRLTTNYIHIYVFTTSLWFPKLSLAAQFLGEIFFHGPRERKRDERKGYEDGDARREETGGWIFWEGTEVKRGGGEEQRVDRWGLLVPEHAVSKV